MGCFAVRYAAGLIRMPKALENHFRLAIFGPVGM
jgi:hypothetical protein